MKPGLNDQGLSWLLLLGMYNSPGAPPSMKISSSGFDEEFAAIDGMNLTLNRDLTEHKLTQFAFGSVSGDVAAGTAEYSF